MGCKKPQRIHGKDILPDCLGGVGHELRHGLPQKVRARERAAPKIAVGQDAGPRSAGGGQ